MKQLPAKPEPSVLDLIEAEQRRNCPACVEGRYHTEEEWKNHPHRGHGYTPETGSTIPK